MIDHEDLLKKTLRYRCQRHRGDRFHHQGTLSRPDGGDDRVAGAFTLPRYKQAFLILFLCGIITLAAILCLRETMEKEKRE